MLRESSNVIKESFTIWQYNNIRMSIIIFIVVFTGTIYCHDMVAYWGQNSVSNSVGPQGYERNLYYYCENFNYDVIAVSFLNVFFDKRDKDKFPSINLSKHCSGSFPNHPLLLHCPNIATDIIKCQQQKSVKIILSLGGAAGVYGFTSVIEAELLAQRIWTLFLGGSSNTRPFDRAVLDGIDLDIEGNGPEYYTEFVRKLRSFMVNDKTKTYLITAAPQCPFPDHRLGPMKGAVLGDLGEEIDQIYIQYYNNWCHPGSGSHFTQNINKWFKYTEDLHKSKGKSPKIYVGLPANIKASGKPIYYQSIEAMKAIYEKQLKNHKFFGGFMLWDAGVDGNNVINGASYSNRLLSFMELKKTHTSTPPSSKSSKSSSNIHPVLITFYILMGILIIAILLLSGRIANCIKTRFPIQK